MAGTGTAHLRQAGQALLRIENLVVEFPAGAGRRVHAVSGISLDLLRGETLGLVGESGCGKSTTGRAIVQLDPATSGRIWFDGAELTALGSAEVRRVRTDLQMIFQDPISSLNPRRRIGEVVAEPLKVWGPKGRAEQRELVDRMLDSVGIDPGVARQKRRHEFSGGQCQRISIARALITNPQVVICDEPVSALDVSVQAQILNLLDDLKNRFGLSLIFIAHDLAVVRNVSDRVAVMYLGKLCEVGDSDVLYATPAHHYTEMLLRSSPVPDPSAHIEELPGGGVDMPSPIDPPSGCRFRTRCPAAEEICAAAEPSMREIGPDHFVACHFPRSGPWRDDAAPSEASDGIRTPAR